MGSEFFNARHKKSALMVYPIELPRFNKLSGLLKREELHATLIFDDESLQALIEKEMTNWLLPPVNLIAAGFTPDWEATGLPADSPIRNMVICPIDSSKNDIFKEITRERAPEPPVDEEDRVNDAEAQRDCSIM